MGKEEISWMDRYFNLLNSIRRTHPELELRHLSHYDEKHIFILVTNHGERFIRVEFDENDDINKEYLYQKGYEALCSKLNIKTTK